MDIPRSREDDMYGVTNASQATFILNRLKNDFASDTQPIPAQPAYLGLGVGFAQAERALSELIQAKKTVFVDINKTTSIPPDSEKFKFVLEGIFTYLESSPPAVFDIITAIQVEYVLLEEKNFREFLRLVSPVLKKNGILYIFPTFHFFPKYIDFIEYGLKNVNGVILHI